MAHCTTPFLLNLNPSEVDEPDVSNDEFLDSLDTIGVWLRVLAAYESLERYTSPDSSSAQRLAALSNIYLQLGAQLEDQAVALVAFSAWSKNRDLVLADLFSRIFLRRRSKATAASEIQAVHEQLKKDKGSSVPVDQRTFFREVGDMSDVEIVEFFLGYKWRTVPSVRLVPSRHIEVWKNLPGELRRIAGSFYDVSQIPRLTAAYNKLKHGPQLIIQNPVERARRFGTSPNVAAQLARYDSLDKPGVRMLFAGARTRGKPTDDDTSSVAPFLIDDEGAAKKIFFGTMVHQANFFSMLVKMHIALYRKTSISLEDLDQGILGIVMAQRHYSTNG